MTLPTMVPHGRAEVMAWCRSVDAGPWASLAVPERVTYTSHDYTVELAAAAALTERVRLWTTIVILPAHDAVGVAKQMASIDVLSGGRLTVGVGVGGREHDYRALSAPFERRWQRMDDQVATMRRIWAGEPPFDGPFLEMPRNLENHIRSVNFQKAGRAITKEQRQWEKHASWEGGVFYATKGYDALLRGMAEAAEGNRNHYLFWAALTMQEEGASDADFESLSATARKNGLTSIETRRTIRSARRTDA